LFCFAAHLQLYRNKLTHAGLIGALGASSTTNTSEGVLTVL